MLWLNKNCGKTCARNKSGNKKYYFVSSKWINLDSKSACVEQTRKQKRSVENRLENRFFQRKHIQWWLQVLVIKIKHLYWANTVFIGYLLWDNYTCMYFMWWKKCTLISRIRLSTLQHTEIRHENKTKNWHWIYA